MCRVLLCEKSNGVPLIYSYSCVQYDKRRGSTYWSIALEIEIDKYYIYICTVLVCIYTFLALDHGVLS
jgi:hypothetical protein